MTLNQVITKIQNISLAHYQIRSFFQGLVTDWMNDKTTKYPAICLQDNGGTISVKGQSCTLTYRMFFVDLVHVSANAKLNINDVQSDMMEVAKDIIAQLARNENDWILSPDENFQLIDEGDNDLHGGVVVDFSIRFPWDQNICAIPTSFTDYTPPGSGGGGSSPSGLDVKVYDLEYIGLGTEGSALALATLTGKKILLITRENTPLYKVSASPDTAEYIWDGITITFGFPVELGARFLILYRNY